MTTIAIDNNLVTLINVFTVEPKDQQKLVDLLIKATEEVMHTLPGFISANMHKSVDGTKVVNYAQWRSTEEFEAILQNPAVKVHLDEAYKIATVEPHLYEVVFVDTRDPSQ